MSSQDFKPSLLPIRNGWILGLDVGIASCGWALLNRKDEQIVGMGVHCFDPSEEPKTRALKNAKRRAMRGQRRVVRRRKQRMRQVREAIRRYGVLADPSPEFFQKLKGKAPNPWLARAKGVEQKLTDVEAAAALIHIAKHRGFKSNSKSEKSKEAAPESKKMLSAMEAKRQQLGGRTFGQMMVEDARDNRRRNLDGQYEFTPKRQDLEEEANRLIERQRALGAEWARGRFPEAYRQAAFHQRDLQSSEHLVGWCPFERKHKRTAKFGYSFERFRFFQKLAHMRQLSEEDIDRIARELNLGKEEIFTYKKLKRILNLSNKHRLEGAPDDEAEKRDITGSRAAFAGTYQLAKALGDDWKRLLKAPEKLDRIAEILTFNESVEKIRRKLSSLALEQPTLKLLMEAVEAGKFARFKGTGNISAKAARKLIPHLQKGLRYNEACDAAGYNFQRAERTALDKIRNPVVQRCLHRSVEQAKILAEEWQCRPKAIHIELLRDVGKSAKERGKIAQGLEQRTKARNKNKDEFLEHVNQSNCSKEQVMMYELLKEQKCQCVYCGTSIRPPQIIDGQNSVQVDHIYPRGRSQDDSFVNKTLCCVGCNQKKGSQTPFECWGRDTGRWEDIKARVNLMTCKREKKRHFLSENFEEREQDFLERNRVDSSYAARTLMNELKQTFYPEDYPDGVLREGGTSRVRARPGRLTAGLREVWLSPVNYRKKRDDDRHHAVDALIVATADEGTLNQMTKHYQQLEKTGRYVRLPDIEPPWTSFAKDAVAMLDDGWLVCRTEKRRVRGAGHEETIRRARLDGGKPVAFFERKRVKDLEESDLERIPAPEPDDPEIYHEQHKDLVASLRRYVSNKAKAATPESKLWPRSFQGDAIRKVRLKTKYKNLRQINPKHFGGERANRAGGFVKNADMTRVDVYRVEEDTQDEDGRRITRGYYLVPVYNWQLINKNPRLPTPMKAITSRRQPDDWPTMDRDNFLFSFYKDSYVVVTRPQGALEGYFRGANSATAAITLSCVRDIDKTIFRSSIKTVHRVQKFTVDRLGRKHEIEREPWPGHEG